MPTITIDGKDHEVADAVAEAYRKKSEAANDLIDVKRKYTDLETKYESVKGRVSGEDAKELRKARDLLEKIPESYRSDEGITKLLRAREHADDYDLLQKDYNKLETRYNKLKGSVPEGFDKAQWEEYVLKDKTERHAKVIKSHIDTINDGLKEKGKEVPEISKIFLEKAWSKFNELDVSDEKATREKVEKILQETVDEQIEYHEKVLGQKGKTAPHPGISGSKEGREGQELGDSGKLVERF